MDDGSDWDVKSHSNDVISVALSEAVPRRFTRTRAAAAHAGPFVRSAAMGALFGAGALLILRALGPSTARSLGEQGGRAFGQGVVDVQNAAAQLRGRAAAAAAGWY